MNYVTLLKENTGLDNTHEIESRNCGVVKRDLEWSGPLPQSFD